MKHVVAMDALTYPGSKVAPVTLVARGRRARRVFVSRRCHGEKARVRLRSCVTATLNVASFGRARSDLMGTCRSAALP